MTNKIIYNTEYKQFKKFIQSIPEQFEREGEVIYKERNEIRLFNVENELINIKRFRIPKIFNRIVYSFFRSPKAKRSFLHAKELIKRGIETPEPVAYIITKHCLLINYSYYITKQATYRRMMYEFGKGGIAGREHILKAFAIFTAKLHESGIYHCDYSPGNILFGEENGDVKFCLVDINRMKFGEVSIEKGCGNFARFWGQKPMFEYLAKIYAESRGADIQYCTEKILKAREKFWKRHAKKHGIGFEL